MAYPETDPVKFFQGGSGREAGYQAGLRADLDQTRMDRGGARALNPA